MKWIITIIAILLIFGHFQTSIAARAAKIWPELKTTNIKPFIRKSYEFPIKEGINVLWWIKYCCEDFLWIITMFCFAKVSYIVSFRLFLVCCVFFIYHLVDGFMLWYDYKTSSGLYWLLDIACFLSVLLLFFPDKKTAIIKSMK